MKGYLKNGVVYLDKFQRLLSRKFGERFEDGIKLLPEESAYLVQKGSLEVFGKEGAIEFEELFELSDPIKYFVFEDLRERGVRINFRDFGEYFPVFETEILEISELDKDRMKVAIVDSEAEVTYFLVEKFSETGTHEEELKEFYATFTNGFFVTDYTDLYKNYFYGSLKGNKVVLSLYEGLYLMNLGFLLCQSDDEKIFQYGIKHIPDFERRYRIYEDLRKRKFMVKTGFKFGSDFRIYESVKSVSELKHSKYLLKIRDSVSMKELACDVRLANAVNKTILYPIFPEKGNEIGYISVKRVRI